MYKVISKITGKAIRTFGTLEEAHKWMDYQDQKSARDWRIETAY